MMKWDYIKCLTHSNGSVNGSYELYCYVLCTRSCEDTTMNKPDWSPSPSELSA